MAPWTNITRRRKSLFSNTLVLPGFDALDSKRIDDQKTLDWAKHSLVLRGRHLEGAVFTGADLRKADLDGAQLQGAWLGGAQLQGASLFGAQLQGASLDGAQLQGASLVGAQLQGASLTRSFRARRDAQLQGASLDGAQLQGASLDGAQLQGASLNSAQLQGASLDGAQLQGASLVGAQLQGANFQEAALVATDLSKAEIWRANFSDAQIDKVFGDGLRETAMSKQDFVKLKDNITKSLPEDRSRDRERSSSMRIEILNPDNTSTTAPDHTKLYAAKADEPAYQQALAGELKNLACSGEGSAASIVQMPLLSSASRGRALANTSPRAGLTAPRSSGPATAPA